MAELRPPLAYLGELPPPLARASFPSLMALGDVAPPQMAPLMPTIPTSKRFPQYDAPQLIESDAATHSEPWSKTTGDRTAFMRRAFETYDPATSNYVGTDPEGRPINSPFHAGTVQGRNVPLNTQDSASVATVLAALDSPTTGHFMSLYRLPDLPPEGRRSAGAMYSSGDRDWPITIEAYRGEGVERRSQQQLDEVKRHEVGHGLGRRGYHNYESIPAMLEAAARLGKPYAGDPAKVRQHMINDPGLREHFNAYADPDRTKRYFKDDAEIFAESFKQYVTDPEAYKARSPEAAAALRAIINNNPRLNKYLTLSRADSAREDA